MLQASGCAKKKKARFFTHLSPWDEIFIFPERSWIPLIYKKGCSPTLPSHLGKMVPSHSISPLNTIYCSPSFSGQPWELSWIFHSATRTYLWVVRANFKSSIIKVAVLWKMHTVCTYQHWISFNIWTWRGYWEPLALPSVITLCHTLMLAPYTLLYLGIY